MIRSVASPRYVLRENVRKRFAPLQGSEGRSVYGGGTARFELAAETVSVRPPFGLAHEAEYEFANVDPLLAALDEDHLVGVLLVRLGGYAVGVFRGYDLLASKVGQRYVQGRHRAGGSSANRFRRRREEQGKALVEEAAETAARVFGPYREGLEAVAVGGDRFALARTLGARSDLAGLRAKALPRALAVPEPRRAVLERSIHDVYAAQVETSA